MLKKYRRRVFLPVIGPLALTIIVVFVYVAEWGPYFFV